MLRFLRCKSTGRFSYADNTVNAPRSAKVQSGDDDNPDGHDCVSFLSSKVQLQQYMSGEHLLNTSATAPVMLVESEKTAVIMSHFIPDYIWLATGGKNGCFNSEAIQVLRGRDVTLVPDLGAADR